MTYRRDPVPENKDDLRRYIDNEYRKLEDETDAIEEYISDRDAIRVERCILRGSNTFTSPTITDYEFGFVPEKSLISTNPQQITFDQVAGTITIGETGIYSVSGYVAQSAGNNNSNYAWGVMTNGVTKLVLGTTVWVQQSNAFTYYAAANFLLLAGDVLRIDAIDDLTGIGIFGSDFEVRLVTVPRAVVSAAALIPNVWDY